MFSRLVKLFVRDVCRGFVLRFHTPMDGSIIWFGYGFQLCKFPIFFG